MKQFRILVVDDDVRILNFLRAKLKASGYEIITASDGNEGIIQVQAQDPELIVLDVLMPGMNGLEMLRQLRSFSNVPVIFLSAKDADHDRIKGLRLGADDYLAKPFNPDELVARIEALRRRMEHNDRPPQDEIFQIGSVTVDFKKRFVSIDGREQYLNRTEWLLLSQLVNNAGRLMMYEDLLTRVWGPEYVDDVQLLRTCISRLRSKLEDDSTNPRIIRTVSKTGYIIDTPQD